MGQIEITSLAANQSQFVQLVESIAAQMLHQSRSKVLDAANCVNPGEVEWATELGRPLIGGWITGKLVLNKYFISNQDQELHEQVIMTSSRDAAHKFGGLFLGLESILVEQESYSKPVTTTRGEILCLKLGHLAGDRSIDQAVKSQDPEWLRLKNHPFSRAEHARKPIWAPIHYLLQDSLGFVDTTAVIRTTRP